MKLIELLSFLHLVCGVFATTAVLDKKDFNETESEKVLIRNKRFLVYVPNGGVLKFVTGYLGPIDM